MNLGATRIVVCKESFLVYLFVISSTILVLNFTTTVQGSIAALVTRAMVEAYDVGVLLSLTLTWHTRRRRRMVKVTSIELQTVVGEHTASIVSASTAEVLA